MKSAPFLSIISKTIPPPLATHVKGSSAIITGIPVSSCISLFSPVSRAPPPVKTIPFSAISVLSSGGVASSAVLAAFVIPFNGS